ncbi:hypothetical protein [Nocardioides sp.]|uniref:hypothetical protein n=1 Tax=Nocardioides sp. TaxID=35761 RepID=UPI002D7F3CE3|nr:hypothetical protein [Nocardioides sp.]HET8959983.1 hypothetical protein [Nocardioides sp.]
MWSSRLLSAAVAGLVLALPLASAPAAGVPTDSTPTEARFVELKAPQPDWYTPALHDRVMAAAARGEGVPVPEGVDYDASGLAFTGIRPGAWIIAPSGCTTNFVFGSGRDYFIGTAGHCAEVGDEVTLIAAPGVLMNIGRTVKSVDRGVGNDFALIDVRPSMEQYVNPSMTYFGGPTGVGSPQPTDVVEHAGHGLVIGTGGTPRAGVVVYRGNGDGGDAFAWVGAASPGDSGSAVRLANGQAAGDLTHIVVGGPYVPGDVAGTTIERMLRIAGKPLATAPDGPDPTS